MDWLLNFFKQNLFTDSKGKKILYQSRRKIAYRIPVSQQNLFSIYYNRLLVCLVLAIILISLDFMPLPVSIGMCAVCYVYFSFYYHKVLLKRCTIIPNCTLADLQKRYGVEKQQKQAGATPRLLMMSAFAILLIVNAHLAKYEGWMMAVCYAVAIIMLADVIRQIIKRT